MPKFSKQSKRMRKSKKMHKLKGGMPIKSFLLRLLAAQSDLVGLTQIQGLPETATEANFHGYTFTANPDGSIRVAPGGAAQGLNWAGDEWHTAGLGGPLQTQNEAQEEFMDEAGRLQREIEEGNRRSRR
jgi:hypothetical protein